MQKLEHPAANQLPSRGSNLEHNADDNELLSRWRQAVHGVEAANYITRIFKPAPTPQQVAAAATVFAEDTGAQNTPENEQT
eukprot:SAG31_NODE_1530_length_7993_cov_7.079807_5_plen_81_part_00